MNLLTMAIDLERWRDVMAALDLPRNDGIHQQLVTAYGEPQRPYHNLGHLETCFAHFEQNAHTFIKRPIFEKSTNLPLAKI